MGPNMHSNKFVKYIKNPWRFYNLAATYGLTKFVPDEPHLKAMYRATIGTWPDLENPRTFNEKLQWLKLHDRNPLYNTLVDKYRVKQWVAERIGEEHVTKTYSMWERAEDIDISELPDRFVLKTNHDCGGIAICHDRGTFDLEAAKKKLAKHMKTNYFWRTREWPYKDVEPCIFAEEYLDPNKPGGDLYDYKLFRFTDGRLVTLGITDRYTDGALSETFFDEEWHALPIGEGGHPTKPELAKPEAFEQMRELAGKLGEGMPFVRVDFYESNGGLYFGELTFYPNSGFEQFDPDKWDVTFGSWIDLTDIVGGGWLLVSETAILWLHEEAVSAPASEGLVDYKFYCFGGEPRFLYVSQGLEDHVTARISFLSMDWEFEPFGRSDYAGFEDLPPKPDSFDEMVSFARRLSSGTPFVRADFYDHGGKAMFSEMTFYPCGGFMPFDPPEWDGYVGEFLDIEDLSGSSLENLERTKF